MLIIREFDRCGAVFTPYRKVISDREKKPTAFVGVSICTFNYKTESLENDKTTTYDLCSECSRQLNVFMENPKDVKHKCYNFGNIDKHNHACKICPMHQECEKATKEKLDAKQKGCNVFGAFDGSVDCLMCPQCDECKKVTNSIKEAILNVNPEGGDANA